MVERAWRALRSGHARAGQGPVTSASEGDDDGKRGHAKVTVIIVMTVISKQTDAPGACAPGGGGR